MTETGPENRPILTPPTSAPNGVTKTARRFMSLGSAVIFFALIIGEYFLNIITKPVPFFLYALLSSIAIVAHDKFEDIIRLFRGGSK